MSTGFASMLSRPCCIFDYGRREGEWVPNRYGGKENIDAIHFLRAVNERVYRIISSSDDDR